MSLTVSSTLLEQAQAGTMQQSDFLACIKDSLPYAWQLFEALATRLNRSDASFVDNQAAAPDEQARGQLLRVRGKSGFPELSSCRALPQRSPGSHLRGIYFATKPDSEPEARTRRLLVVMEVLN